MSLQLQESEQQSITKSQSNSHIKSVASRHESITSKQSSIPDIVRYQLLAYGDVNEADFLLLQTLPNQNELSSEEQYSSYMNIHVTQVPVGPNYQAQIPAIKSIGHYLQSRKHEMWRLEQLKIQSPEQQNLFYLRHRQQIGSILGQRTQQQIQQIHLNYTKKCNHSTLEQYLGQEEIQYFWEQWFNRHKTICKSTKKKKKKYR